MRAHHHDPVRIFGVTKIAERGQIVLPIEARQSLGLKPGETLMAVNCCGVLTLMRPRQLEGLLDRATVRLRRHLNRVQDIISKHR